MVSKYFAQFVTKQNKAFFAANPTKRVINRQKSKEKSKKGCKKPKKLEKSCKKSRKKVKAAKNS